MTCLIVQSHELIVKAHLHHISGKWCCDDTRIAAVMQEKSPQLKTAYWKCPIVSVYVNTIDDNWRHLRVLNSFYFTGEDFNHFPMFWACIKIGNGVQPEYYNHYEGRFLEDWYFFQLGLPSQLECILPAAVILITVNDLREVSWLKMKKSLAQKPNWTRTWSSLHWIYDTHQVCIFCVFCDFTTVININTRSRWNSTAALHPSA